MGAHEITGQLREAIYVVMRDSNGLLKDRRLAFIESENARADVAVLKIDGDVFNKGLSTCPEVRSSRGRTGTRCRGFPVRVDGGLDQIEGDSLEASSGAVFEMRIEDGGRRRFWHPHGRGSKVLRFSSTTRLLGC